MSKEAYGISMETEIWRTKPEWEGYYEFSNWGGARSVDRWLTYSNGSTRLQRGKKLKINPDGSIVLQIQGKRYPRVMRNIIAELFIDGYKEGMPISFRDNNEANCSLDNIIIGVVRDDTCETRLLPYNLNITNELIHNIPVIEGGFNEGQRVLFDITLAEKVGKPVGDLRSQNITSNLDKWEEGVDYIDLMKCSNFNDFIPLLMDLGYSMNSFIKSNNIFILSERGVAKVMSTLKNSNPAKWEFLNNFVNEYFEMREQIKNQQNTLEQKKKDLLFAIYTGGQAGIIASKQLTEIEVQEATAPLIETIEEQKPKVAKYDKLMESDGTYNATNAAKILDIPSAQQFNKLLKDNKIQYKSGGNWVLYSKYQWLIDEGFAKYIEGENTNYSYIQLRWFPKGIEWIRDNVLAI